MNIKDLDPKKTYTADNSTLYYCVDEDGTLNCRSSADDIWQHCANYYNDVLKMNFHELHQWTPDELILMRLLPPGCTWIARDNNNRAGNYTVFAYPVEPIWEEATKIFVTKAHLTKGILKLSAYNHVFTSIEPGEKYPIQRS